jgi:hypothetical protein
VGHAGSRHTSFPQAGSIKDAVNANFADVKFTLDIQDEHALDIQPDNLLIGDRDNTSRHAKSPRS